MTASSRSNQTTWVEVAFTLLTEADSIEHRWTIQLDFNFLEAPMVGDAIILRGSRTHVAPTGVDQDGNLGVETSATHDGASVALEVMVRAWLREGVLIRTVPYEGLELDEAMGETLVQALDVVGFKSVDRGETDTPTT